MVQIAKMCYPNDRVEYNFHDKIGRILAVNDTQPSEKPAKERCTSGLQISDTLNITHTRTR